MSATTTAASSSVVAAAAASASTVVDSITVVDSEQPSDEAKVSSLSTTKAADKGMAAAASKTDSETPSASCSTGKSPSKKRPAVDMDSALEDKVSGGSTPKVAPNDKADHDTAATAATADSNEIKATSNNLNVAADSATTADATVTTVTDPMLDDDGDTTATNKKAVLSTSSKASTGTRDDELAATGGATAGGTTDDIDSNTLTPKVDLTRPVKRARTAYFIFADERRAQVQSQHPGQGVAVVARALGQLWTALTADDKLPYQQQAALEREQVAAATEAWNKVHGNSAAVDAAIGAAIDDNGNTMHKDSTQLIFPMARIRKICKLDPDVRGLSKEATLLITKCAELVTAKLGVESVRMATIQNRRKLLPEDVVQVCSAREQFLFLREDMVDLVRRTQVKEPISGSGDSGAAKPSSSSSALSSSTNSKGAKDNALAAKNTKPLTAFFKAAS